MFVAVIKCGVYVLNCIFFNGNENPKMNSICYTYQISDREKRMKEDSIIWIEI